MKHTARGTVKWFGLNHIKDKCSQNKQTSTKIGTKTQPWESLMDLSLSDKISQFALRLYYVFDSHR